MNVLVLYVLMRVYIFGVGVAWHTHTLLTSTTTAHNHKQMGAADAAWGARGGDDYHHNDDDFRMDDDGGYGEPPAMDEAPMVCVGVFILLWTTYVWIYGGARGF